jgi:hypothetical protein
MFMGHYGVSFVLKRAQPQLSLGLLFVSVQLLDVLFCVFVLAGLEKMRIVPGFTEYNSYDLYFMPYTHSLVGAMAWSLLALGTFFVVRGRQLAAAVTVGVAVFSHFVLDVPVHTPDMPVLGMSSPKLGFGLWNYRWVALGLELVCLGIGLLVYLRAPGAGVHRSWVTLPVVGILVILTVATPFFPTPPSGAVFAVQALISYGALAAIGEWFDRSRTRDSSLHRPSS